MARRDGSVKVYSRFAFFRSFDKGERVAGRTDGVMTARIHPHRGEIADTSCRRLLRL